MLAEVGHDVLVNLTYNGSFIVKLKHAKICKHLTLLRIKIGLAAYCSILIKVGKSIRLGYTHLAKCRRPTVLN